MARLMFGVTRPRQPVLGTELAGVIESAGKKVKRFKAGDGVFAFPGGKMGCHAQYRVMAEDGPIAFNSPLLKYRSDQAGSWATAITTTANPS